MKKKQFFPTFLGVVCCCLPVLAYGQSDGGGKPGRADVIVYGGTPAGITAAIAVARSGKSVILIEPGNHLGGAVAGGLGATDKGIEETVGGLSRHFFERVGKHYGKPISWSFEPHVAEQTFETWIAESSRGKITVIRGERLDLRAGVEKKGTRIRAIRMESGRRFAAKIFIDATYEGDLVAGAGVSYHVGRESRDRYGESLAGVFDPGVGPFLQPKQFFPQGVSPWRNPDDPSSGLLPGIQGVGLDAPGSEDAKIQAYNFRICLSTDPDNRIPITRPERYDPARYELLGRLLQAAPKISLRRIGARRNGLLTIGEMPNHKTDINDGGPFSTDYIGANWDYPEGDYETRERIVREHVDFTKGLLWFIASDPRVPEEIRDDMQRYGYPKDEYPDNDHWSHQLYVRETRRMIGSHILRQQDCLEQTSKEDSIGMGSYAPDSHHLQRVVIDGNVVNEGNFYLSHHPYEIPYGVLTPQESECTNLLVPVCLSASHVAFGSVRMEPVFMILGESAGAAAAMAIDDSVSVQDIKIAALRGKLLGFGQRLKLGKWVKEKKKAARQLVAPKGGLLIDDTEAVFKGEWSNGKLNPLIGPGYRHDRETPKGEGKATFRFRVPADGEYVVRLLFRAHSNRAGKVPATVSGAAGKMELPISIDQQKGDGVLGKFTFKTGSDGVITFSNTGTKGIVVIDGLLLSPVP